VSLDKRVQTWPQSFGAAIPLMVLMIAILSLVLTSAQALNLSTQETTSWIIALYGFPGLLSLVLIFIFRLPLLLTGNVFMIIFIGSQVGQLSYAEIIGASIAAGLGVLIVSLLGLTEKLATWVPTPIVMGLLAGPAADLPNLMPLSLLLTLAGLSLVDVFISGIKAIAQGPLILGPIFAFVVGLSQISLFGLGPAFWSLVLGIGVTLLLEPHKLPQLQQAQEAARFS
jgi:predicted benzoate:H+ symporter BenE